MNRAGRRILKSVFIPPNARDTISVIQTRNLKRLTGLFSRPSHIYSQVFPRRLHSAARNETPENSGFIFHEPEHQDDRERLPPLVLLFGWAEASHEKLSKYSEIYLLAGCATAQYILPGRFIFRDSQEVPSLMSCLHSSLASKNLSRRPVLIHCLSDTGVLCYQGLTAALALKKTSMDISGVVWDYGSVGACWRFLVDTDWQNMDDGKEDGGSKLVVHSQTDFYIPSDYLEKDVLPLKGVLGKWDKLGALGHLKHDKEEFASRVRDFVSDNSNIDSRMRRREEKSIIVWYGMVWCLANFR